MSWFANRNTVHKLTLSFGLCLLLALTVGLIALAQMGQMNHSAKEVAFKSLPGTAAIGETLNNITQLRILEWRRILAPDHAERTEVEANMDAKVTDVAQNLMTYAETMTHAEDRKNYLKVRALWHDYLTDHRTLMRLNQSGNLVQLSTFMQGKSCRDFDAIERILTNMLVWNRTNGKMLAQGTTQTYLTARMLMLLLLLSAVGIGIMTAYHVTQSITSPLNKMAKAVASVADRVAVGDVTQTIDYYGHDELGRLAESLRAILSYQKEMTVAAETIAAGDLTQCVIPKSDMDVLGHTFNRMIHNLRQLVDALTNKSEALQESERRYRSVVDNVRDVFFLADATGHWTFLNPAWTAITGYGIEESLGQVLLHYVVEEDRPRHLALFDLRPQHQPEYYRQEVRIRSKTRDICWVEARIQCNIDSSGEVIGFFGTLSDITERKQAEAQLQHQALHDSLTGLPNRVLFHDRLQNALTRSQCRNAGIALLFVDLDNFKFVNDSMGHETGDLLLKAIASRLVDSAHAGDTIARLGGDEFTLLLEGLDSVDQATSVAEHIVTELQQPITLGERQIFASASIGVAYSSSRATSSADLLRDADTAMYHAKTNGKSNYVLFNTGMNSGVMERIEIEAGLRIALKRAELQVYYQPLIDLKTGRMSGAEALVRWQHPTRGMVLPGKFIPIAEETGMILPIGYWVLEQACLQRQAWKRDFPKSDPFVISVNLSGKQLMQADVVDRVIEIVGRTGIAPEELKLEITESIMMADVEDSVVKLTRLKEFGVKLALDDFGTGYSSMAILKVFPLDTIKIDRAFISQLATEDARSVIAAIVMLSRALNLDVTGEGIETEDQVLQLQGLGCQTGQGYHFASPLTADAMAKRLTDNLKVEIKNHNNADLEMIERLLSGVLPV